MTTLPPDLAAFTSVLDAQPAPVRDAFNHCLCLLMVEAGKMRPVEKVPGEHGTMCVFETTALSGLQHCRLHKVQHKAEDQDKRLVNGVTLLLAGSACDRQPVLASIALQLQRHAAVARLLSLRHVH